MDPLKAVNEIAKMCDGKITEVGILPGNSGYAIISMPLPKDHWIYQGDRQETYGVFNTPPMPFRMGSKDRVSFGFERRDDVKDPPDAGIVHGMTMTKEGFEDLIKEAGRYAVRCATMNGKEMDFDPDALLQSLVVGMLGYWTEDGLSSDEWDNPKGA